MSTSASKSKTVCKSIGLVVWVAAIYGSLQIHYLEGNFDHAICGPWGCGPPVMALVGCHVFWFLLVAPPALAAGFLLPADRALRIGKFCAIVGLGSLAWVVAADGIRFWQSALSSEFLLQRILFCLATFVELPLGLLGLAGLAIRQLGKRRIRSSDSSPAENTL